MFEFYLKRLKYKIPENYFYEIPENYFYEIHKYIFWKIATEYSKNYNQSFFIYIRCPFEGLNIVNYKFIDCANGRSRENIPYYHEIAKQKSFLNLFKKA